MLKQYDTLSDDAVESASIFGSYFASTFRPDDYGTSTLIEILNILMPKLKIATFMI